MVVDAKGGEYIKMPRHRGEKPPYFADQVRVRSVLGNTKGGHKYARTWKLLKQFGNWLLLLD